MFVHSVVYDPAKVIILKANHNKKSYRNETEDVVYDPAKLRILKANHNYIVGFLK